MDMFSPERRSQIMGRIRSVDTEPEMAVRRFLHARGLRFRLHDRSMPGRPDLVLKKYRAAVYVNGCFWHGHNCKDGRRPKSNEGYWNEKLDRNVRRDQAIEERLQELGWKRVVIWACETKKPEALERLIAEVMA